MFGRSGADLIEATFVVQPDGERWVEDAFLKMNNDNLDFNSVDGGAQLINDLINRPLFDPFDIGAEIKLNCSSIINVLSGARRYTNADFLRDEGLGDDVWQSSLDIAYSTPV